MLIFDALGRSLEIRRPPERIVSLVPSLTELLFELNAPVAGVSDYCLHPAEKIASLPRVGGQKDPDLAKLLALRPDFVVVAKEENLRRDVEKLEAAGVPVYVTDVKSLDDAMRLPYQLGGAVGVPRERCERLRAKMAAGVDEARRQAAHLRVLCYVWREPWIAAGGDTYLSDVLAACGGVNVLAERTRYPKLPLEEARALRPDLIVLPSEPYPFSERDLPSVENGVLVDGTVLCWYGPRTARIGEIAVRLRQAAAATAT